MGDAIFRELLTEVGKITRPRVELDMDGGPKTPVYDEVESEVAVRLQPADTASNDDLLGRDEDVTCVAYLEVTDLRSSDRLVLREAETTLLAEAAVGVTELCVTSTKGFTDGAEIVVGSNGGSEEHVVVAVDGTMLTIAEGLKADHSAGETVSVIRRFEVVSVEDEAGAGHHLRAVVREL